MQPVPSHLLPQFVEFMQPEDDQQLSGAQWLGQLAERASDFLLSHRLAGRGVDAVAQYMDAKRSFEPLSS